MSQFMRLLFVTTLLLAGSVAFTVQAEERGLDVVMDEMNDHYKVIGRGLRQPDPARQQEFVDACVAMITLSEESKSFEPPMAAKMAGQEKADHIAAYKKKMDDMIASLNELKALLEAGKLEEAATFFAAIKDHKKTGHDGFEPE